MGADLNRQLRHFQCRTLPVELPIQMGGRRIELRLKRFQRPALTTLAIHPKETGTGGFEPAAKWIWNPFDTTYARPSNASSIQRFSLRFKGAHPTRIFAVP